MSKKLGFTISEVLIVLIVVGIIATLSVQTIATQKQNYSFSYYYLYNDLKNVIGHMASSTYAGTLDSFSCEMAADGGEQAYKNCVKYGKTNSGTMPAGFINFKTDEGFCRGLSMYLGTASSIDCTNLNNAQIGGNVFEGNEVFGNMSNISFRLLNKSLVYVSSKVPLQNYRIVTFDINGKSGPNENNKDIISFAVFDNGEVLPVGSVAKDTKAFMTVVKMRDMADDKSYSQDNEEMKTIRPLMKEPASIIRNSNKKNLSFQEGYCRAYGESLNCHNYCPDTNYSETFKYKDKTIPVSACYNHTSGNSSGVLANCEFSVLKPRTPDFIPTPTDTYTTRGLDTDPQDIYEISKF